MAIGIAVVVGLHALRETVSGGVNLQSRALLGADLRLSSRAPLDDDVLGRVAALSPEASSTITRFGSMALVERTGRSRLVDVQALSGGYPFYGSIITAPAQRWSGLSDPSAAREALVDPSLLIQLDAKVGDTLVLGEARFEISGEIRKAPGSFGLQTQVAPRVFIPERHLGETGLVQLGSMVEHLRFLRVPETSLEPWLAENEAALEAARVRIQTVASYQEDLSQNFAALTRYLGLVGLAALALGSIGVASGVRVFVREKFDSVAVLRSIGARPREVVAIYSLLAIVLGGAAGVLGVVLCLPLLWAFPILMQDVLPIEVAFRLEPVAIATGVILGLWATAVCAIGPLLDLGAVAPLRALRRDFAAESDDARPGQRFVFIALAVSVLAASIWQAPRLSVGLGFAAGLVTAVGLLAGCARLAVETLRRHPPRRASYWLRQGIANLFRPRNHTLPTTVAIGFALFLVATLHAVQHSVLSQIALDSSGDRPNIVLFDVQLDQTEPLAAFLDERGARTVESAPLVSARLGALRGVASEKQLEERDLARELRWALRREYRLTYRRELRDTETIVAGEWWGDDVRETDGALPVSMESDLAKRLELAIGDRITWQVQGVDVESVVTSIRKVDWGKLATNFFVVMPPKALENAPQSSVVLAHLADGDARAALQRDLVAEFPNVSALDATVILRAVDATMAQVSTAIRVLALFTLGTGLAILLAAATAARSERMREALLLRVLGASLATVRRIQVTEALALGALAAGVGGGLSLLGGWALVYFVFELPFSPPWLDLFGLIFATLAITALLGAVGSRHARELSPQAALRASERLGTGAA